MKKSGIILSIFLLVLSSGFIATRVQLIDLIGQSVKSEDAKTFIKESGKYKKFKASDSYYYMFNSLGFDLMMSKKDTVTAVFVYAEGADEHRAYTEELPEGLKVTLDRREVEAILGVPDATGGEGVIPFYCSWNDKGIAITYQSKDEKDMINKVHNISFMKKLPVGK
jgi:hypothetical protein